MSKQINFSVTEQRVARRTTLKWLAATLGYSALHGKVLAGTFKPTAKGYGTDPDLNNTKAGWDRQMTKGELQSTALLADLILPGTADAPAPSVLGVHEFVDEWFSAPYPDQLRDRAVIRLGLAWLDDESLHRFGKGFVQTDDAKRLTLLTEIAAANSTQHGFFRRMRYLIVGAYFSSDIGMKDLGYTGNVALDAFPPPTEEMHAIIDRECKALGI